MLSDQVTEITISGDYFSFLHISSPQTIEIYLFKSGF